MSRIFIHVEGQTEEDFVNNVLAEHLYKCGYTDVSARLIGNPRQHDRRGGIQSWSSVRTEILNHLKDDVACLATTMVDYYGMPKTGPRAWPGREGIDHLKPADRAAAVERALLADVCKALGEPEEGCRFIPFVTMHEFEALLFSDPARFASSIGRSDLSPQFRAIRDEFATPEDIDDSPQTAPSKRVIGLMPAYQKPLMGVLAALDIGLATIQAECPLFAAWVGRLEQRCA